MSRLRDLPAGVLDDLPEACRACTFWEAGGPRPGRPGHEPAQARDGKDAWWHATQLEWGVPAKGVYDGDVLVGYAAFAPGEHFTRARNLPHPPSEDALLLATLWVAPAFRGGGLAKSLVQAVLREAHRHGCAAVEAYATRDVASPSPSPPVAPPSPATREAGSSTPGAGKQPGGQPRAADVRPPKPASGAPGLAAGSGCVIPEAFLLGYGFRVRHEHDRLPLLRLELRQSLRWQESVGHALEAVISAIGRRERVPAPTQPA